VVEVWRVEVFECIEPPWAATHEFPHRLRTLAWFVLREGPRLAWRKAKAARLSASVARARRITAVLGRSVETGNVVIAAGEQDCPFAEMLAFPAPLTIAARDDGTAAFDRLCAALEQSDELRAEVARGEWRGSRWPATSLERLLPDQSTAASGRRGQPVQEVLVGRSGRRLTRSRPSDERPNLLLVGCGAYARAYALPNLPGFRKRSAVDLNPALAWRTAVSFGFESADSSVARALTSIEPGTPLMVVVAGYHSTHTDVAAAALSTHPACRVFIEKPPVTTWDQLSLLRRLRGAGGVIQIGYNRRFAPMSVLARSVLKRRSGPLFVTCVVKELAIPRSHWYHWPEEGTRIAGNLCHWVDLAQYFIEGTPVRLVLATPRGSAGDSLSASVEYADGSQATLIASDLGNGLRGVQEYIQLRREDVTVTIDDYLRCTIDEGGRRAVHRAIYRDKGHRAMYVAFASRQQARDGHYGDRDLLLTSSVYLRLTEMLRGGLTESALETDRIGSGAAGAA
jgi:predicted dehydrogenase